MVASRKLVTSHASGRKAIVHIQQLTGGSTAQGFTDAGTWADVPGLSNVPVTFRTWSPYEKMQAAQDFPGVGSRAYMRWRRGVIIRSNGQVRTGFMLDSVHVEDGPNAQTKFVIAGAPYSVYQNYGTRFIPARAFWEPGIEPTRPGFEA